MAFRKYQEEIYSAVINKRDWMGSNVNVETNNGITDVFDNGGYTNAATTARINAVKEACDHLGYNY